MLLAWSLYLVVVSTGPGNLKNLRDSEQIILNRGSYHLGSSPIRNISGVCKLCTGSGGSCQWDTCPWTRPGPCRCTPGCGGCCVWKIRNSLRKKERTGKIRIKPGREKKSLSKICLSAKTVKLFFSGKKVDFGLREKSSQGKWKERNWKRLKIELRRTIDVSLWTEKWMFWEKIDAFKYSFFDPIANRGYLFTSPNE